MPINIVSTDCNISLAPYIAPIGPGVAFILPFDNNVYNICFTAVLKINTENVPLNPPNTIGSIFYLQGSGNILAQPAVAQVIVYQLDINGVAIDNNPAAAISFSWNNICINPQLTPPPPNNFKVFQEPTIPGPGGAYYQSCSSNSNPSFNIIPILGPNGKPLARRLITVLVTDGFSFSEAIMTITRVPCSE